MQYQVKIDEIVCHTVEVEADSVDAAYEIAHGIVSNGDETTYTTESEGFTGGYDVYELYEIGEAK